MKDYIQYLGKQEKEYLFRLGDRDDQMREAFIISSVMEAINDELFLQFIKADPKLKSQPDYLLAIGVKLLLKYQGIREATEKREFPPAPEDQENMYYAASAFLHVYEIQSRPRYVC